MKDESKFIESLIDPETRDLAFEKLVQEFKKPIYWHIRKIVLNHDDAHDVLQNTFIKVFRGIDKFKFKSKLYTWIYRIATNESLNFIKSKAKKFLMSSKEMMDYQINNLKEDPYFDGDELQISLQKAINSLPTKQKLIFSFFLFRYSTTFFVPFTASPSSSPVINKLIDPLNFLFCDKKILTAATKAAIELFMSFAPLPIK